jgi:hypothetical protein
MKNIGDELIVDICANLSSHYNEIFVGTMSILEALGSIQEITGVGPEARPPGTKKDKLIENLKFETNRRINDGDIPRRDLSLLKVFQNGEVGSKTFHKHEQFLPHLAPRSLGRLRARLASDAITNYV